MTITLAAHMFLSWPSQERRPKRGISPQRKVQNSPEKRGWRREEGVFNSIIWEGTVFSWRRAERATNQGPEWRKRRRKSSQESSSSEEVKAATKESPSFPVFLLLPIKFVPR